MILLNKISFFLIAFIGSWFLAVNDLPFNKSTNKKIERSIKRVWQEEAFEFTEANSSNSALIGGNQNLFEIQNEGDLIGYLQYRNANGCTLGGCSDEYLSQEKSTYKEWKSGEENELSYETFAYFILYEPDFSVANVTIAEYNSDHGYEIAGRNWLKQFIGFKGEDLTIGEDIDGISGATISANSITHDIQRAYDLFCIELCD